MPSLADQINALEPGIVRIFRDADEDVGFREALIFLDGEYSGAVDFKKVLELPVRAGSHSLRASNRVLKTKEITFDIQPGERISFQVANVGGIFFKFFMMLCMGIPGIRLRREQAENAHAPVNLSGRPVQ